MARDNRTSSTLLNSLRMQWDCVERPLSRLFYRYGKFVARHPFPFLIIPVLVACVLSSGFHRLSVNTDIEYLYTPENGRAKTEKHEIAAIFPQNTSHEFDAMRTLDAGKYIRIIVTAREGGSVLRDDLFHDIIQLDKDINKGSILKNGTNVSYADVCARIIKDACANNNFILSLAEGYNMSVSSLDLTYPVSQIDVDLRAIPLQHLQNIKQHKMSVFIGSTLGGVTTSNDSKVVSAQAMQLVYYFRDDTPEHKTASAEWVSNTAKELLQITYPKINITLMTSETLVESIVETSLGVIPLFAITVTVLVSFSILSCMMLSWVTSKPFLGLSGVLSAGLAVVSAFGLMFYIGVDFIEICATTPFLILAIGVDGMFVMLASWRLTDLKKGYVERMGVTCSEAGLSVLITNLTDGLAFAVGAVTFYPSVRTFCLYTGVAVLFNFIFQITFFAAVLALTGKREEQNRHCLMFCMRLTDKQEKEKDSTNKDEHIIMKFFRTIYGPVLMKPIAKAFVILVYLAYLAVAVYYCLSAQEGIKMRNLAQDDSYAMKFYDEEAAFFSSYGPSLSVMIDKNVNLSSDGDIANIKTVLAELETSQWFAPANESVSWLTEFEKYAETHNLPRDLQTLVDRFFEEPAYMELSRDVVIEGNSTISSCRFFLRSINMADPNSQKHMMVDSRDIADASPNNVTVYTPAFMFYDQYVTVIANTMQNIGIATGSMLLVSLFLIPNPVCVIWVFFSICSICTGVVGYMTLWDVDFDSIAMINLIMCIGFCVDFCAHITYVYSVSNLTEPSQRVSDALGYLGYPILQGGLSTIIGVVPLAFASAYTIRVFFKIVFLVIAISAFHGLLVLPVMLGLTGQKHDKLTSQSSGSLYKTGASTVNSASVVYPEKNKVRPVGYCAEAVVSDDDKQCDTVATITESELENPKVVDDDEADQQCKHVYSNKAFDPEEPAVVKQFEKAEKCWADTENNASGVNDAAYTRESDDFGEILDEDFEVKDFEFADSVLSVNCDIDGNSSEPQVQCKDVYANEAVEAKEQTMVRQFDELDTCQAESENETPVLKDKAVKDDSEISDGDFKRKGIQFADPAYSGDGGSDDQPDSAHVDKAHVYEVSDVTEEDEEIGENLDTAKFAAACSVGDRLGVTSC